MERFLFITIDTEEDAWGSYGEKRPSVENLKNLSLLQDIFRRYAAVPTYLINYPVATDRYAINMLRSLMENGQCDIGTHCHPWNTPPYEELPGKQNSLLCNLPERLVGDKIQNVHDAIERNFGFQPVSFRAGRWGFGSNVLRILQKSNYEIDTSIRPFVAPMGAGCSDSTLLSNSPFWIDSAAGRGKASGTGRHRDRSSCRILEIPPTIGFMQENFERCYRIRSVLKKHLAGRLLSGILKVAGIINPCWLSPEYCRSSGEMIALTKAVMGNGHRIVNLFFHSTSLLPGKTPYVQTRDDLDRFLQALDEYLLFASVENFRSIGLSEAKAHLIRTGHAVGEAPPGFAIGVAP